MGEISWNFTYNHFRMSSSSLLLFLIQRAFLPDISFFGNCSTYKYFENKLFTTLQYDTRRQGFQQVY